MIPFFVLGTYSREAFMITSTNILTLANELKKQDLLAEQPDFGADRLPLATEFRKHLESAFGSLNDASGEIKNITWSILIGGSAPWQYINALIHGTKIVVSDTDLYAIPNAEQRDLVRKLRGAIATTLTRELKLQPSDMFVSNPKDVLHYISNGNDYNLVNNVEVFSNFQIFIDEQGEIVYSPDIATHKDDFARFISEHKIICYKLETLINGAKNYAQNPGENAAGKEEFKKLTFVMKSLYKPMSVGKTFDYGTAKCLKDLLNDDANAALVQLIAARMGEQYHAAFVSPDNANSHIQAIKEMANKVVADTSPEDKEKYFDQKMKEYQKLLADVPSEPNPDLQNELRLTQNQLKRAKKTIHETKQEFFAEQKKVADTEEKLARAQAYITSIENSLNLAKTGYDQLMEANNFAHTEIANLRHTISTLKMQSNAQQEVISKYEQNQKLLEKQIADLSNSNANNTQVWALQSTIDRLEGKVEALEMALRLNEQQHQATSTSSMYRPTDTPSAGSSSEKSESKPEHNPRV
jgi:peptidoglycan hydrolase CwlO-like protein